MSSRHSLPSSHRNGGLRKRKEDLFQAVAPGRERGELLERALAADVSAAQQHESIADPRGVGNLMNRQQQRPSRRGVAAQRAPDVSRLAEIETVERFVTQEDRLWCQQADAQERSFALALGKIPDARIEKRRQIELLDDCPRGRARTQAKKADGENRAPTGPSVPARARSPREGKRTWCDGRLRSADGRLRAPSRGRQAGRRRGIRATWSCPIRSDRSIRAPRPAGSKTTRCRGP